MDDLMNVGLQEELIADLTEELSGEPTFDPSILLRKIIAAIREVKRARKYPDYYTETQIDKDIYEYYSNIRSIALYDYNKVGGEFEESTSENSTNRSWVDRNKLFNGILPLAR